MRRVQAGALLAYIGRQPGSWALLTRCRQARRVASGIGITLAQRDELLAELERQGAVRFVLTDLGLPAVQLVPDAGWTVGRA